LVSDIKGSIETEDVWNMWLRRMFGIKRDEITREWKEIA
jgi:hypothetical protein